MSGHSSNRSVLQWFFVWVERRAGFFKEEEWTKVSFQSGEWDEEVLIWLRLVLVNSVDIVRAEVEGISLN